MKSFGITVISIFMLIAMIHCSAALANAQQTEFRVLATNKTSTMQKEMSEAADAGFRFEGVFGGETAFGGSETVIVMSRQAGADRKVRYDYRLLATSKTSTMEKELRALGDEGFEYKGQTIFKTTFGGKEVVVIMERNRDSKAVYEYKLLATSKTSTMQKELQEAGAAGYTFLGITVGSTAFGGNELVVIMKKK